MGIMFSHAHILCKIDSIPKNSPTVKINFYKIMKTFYSAAWHIYCAFPNALTEINFLNLRFIQNQACAILPIWITIWFWWYFSSNDLIIINSNTLSAQSAIASWDIAVDTYLHGSAYRGWDVHVLWYMQIPIEAVEDGT